MKLFVIVFCLLSERFLVHVMANHRFRWFMKYSQVIERPLSKVSFLSSPWMMLTLALFPMLLAAFLIFHFLSNGFFGFIGLLLNIIVLYSCLGPGNPFYPIRNSTTKDTSVAEIGNYFADCNGQVFAPIFWYLVLGPMAVLTYRLVAVSYNLQKVRKPALRIIQLLDWLPARMTALLYMLVGNFQQGFHYFSKLFFSSPEKNHKLISQCGLNAMDAKPTSEAATMPQAERLVEHAIIALLVLLACFTLFAWM